jgi:hypothetical protein
MLSTFLSYQLIARDLDRSLALKSAERPVALETQYYLKKIGDVKSIEDLLKDTRLFRYAMKAFGLEDMAHAKGMMRKVLEEGVATEDTFANRLSDDRFKEFAKVFDFAGKGALATVGEAARQGVVDRYVRQSLEISAGEDNEGVRLALYFQRAAPEIDSPYDLLADPAAWKVVRTIFGFPVEMAAADIEKQAAAVEARLDVADLKDPEKLDRLIKRFTTMWDVSENTAPPPILELFDKRAPSVGLELLMTLTNLKRGG